MTPDTLAIVTSALAAVAAVLALVFKFQLAETSATATINAEARDQLKEALDALEQKVQRREKEQAKRNEETADLRRKLDRLKKRTKQHQHEADEVPEEISKLQKELAKEKASAVDAKEQLHQARIGVATLRNELDGFKSGENTDRQAAETTELKHRIESLEKRAEDADARAARAVEESATAKKRAAKYKTKNEVLDKTYLILRGEHELKKDEAHKLRAEVERLLALRVGITEDTTTTPPDTPLASEPDDATESDPDSA